MSISPLELRLGNLVDVITEEGLVHECTVVAISNDSISVMKDGTGMIVEPEHLSPITLTDEWCDKLFKETSGFSHCKIWALGEGFKLAMHKDHRDFSILHEMVSPSSWMIIREVLYLHQLQNIVYFNTGTELTIKETERLRFTKRIL